MTAYSATTGAGYYLSCLYAIWSREVKRSVRESGQLVGAFSRPLLWVIIFGVGLTPYFRTGLRETTFVVPFTYMQYIFPAVVVLNILYPSIQSAVSLIYDRQFGFFREVFASPVPRSAVFFGKLLGGATVATLQGGLVLLLAPYVDVAITPAMLPGILGVMLLVSLAFTAVGLLIASRLKSFEGFGVFSNALILPLYFLASSVFPLDPSLSVQQQQQVFPAWLVLLVRANPLTYAIDLLRGFIINYREHAVALDVGVVLALTLTACTVAYREFRR
ncbi:transport permease protein (plasmid) [Deinococcus aetherius]|uniref:Transport permease protein n=1 Tax=Deinococcus aetherius TaxID=200252 RepID=A0ABM8AK42_9DEIO|nr:ABC transporter permease [Deinococcus aetherius]BDP44191.1 transport permease protein [Deinococcus aetherius]